MNGTVATLALGLVAFGLSSARADFHDGEARTVAVEACQAANPYGPARLVEAVEDGLGDYLAWMEDRDGDLWMCNANADGEIYVNLPMAGDLLAGRGRELVAGLLQTGPRQRGFGQMIRQTFDPQRAAEQICLLMLSGDPRMTITASLPDGVGDYLIWLEGEDGLWLCNASGDMKIYALEPIDYPVDARTPGRSA